MYHYIENYSNQELKYFFYKPSQKIERKPCSCKICKALAFLFFFLHTNYGSLQELKFKFSRRYFSHTVLKRIFRNKQLLYPYLRQKNVLCLSCAFTCFQLGYLSEFELNLKILKNLSNPMRFLQFHITSSPALFSSKRNLYKKNMSGKKVRTESLKQSSICMYFYL